jgi:hypothetical protein
MDSTNGRARRGLVQAPSGESVYVFGRHFSTTTVVRYAPTMRLLACVLPLPCRVLRRTHYPSSLQICDVAQERPLPPMVNDMHHSIDVSTTRSYPATGWAS